MEFLEGINVMVLFFSGESKEEEYSCRIHKFPSPRYRCWKNYKQLFTTEGNKQNNNLRPLTHRAGRN